MLLDRLMPRTSEVPRDEKMIGSRLREIREETRLTGTAFALKHGLSAGNLSKYEHGRVPLPWRAGDAICARESISQRWLATGVGPKAPYLLFQESVLQLIPRRATFSFAYDNFLEPRLEEMERDYRSRFKRTSKTDAYGFAGFFDTHAEMCDSWLPLFNYILDAWYFSLPEDDRFDLVRRLEKSLLEYLREKQAVVRCADIEREMVRLTGEFFAQERAKQEDRKS